MSFGLEKSWVRRFFEALEQAPDDQVESVVLAHCAPQHHSYLSFPFRHLDTPSAFANEFWQPFKQSFSALQRREDIFFAGRNASDDRVWVVSMGHYMGLFDRPWLGIPHTRRTTMVRYAEFHQVENEQIMQSGLFVDLISVMRQAGFDPLPQETGHSFVYPGPRTHDGVLLDDQDPAESTRTAALIDRMVDDLNELNISGNDQCPPELLARTWHDDMAWYGPAGIGATHTIERYQEQHQYPFRQGLKNKAFHGHVARIAEGNYAGFFGWPNLSNSPAGFLGTRESDQIVEMQVVDIYRRDGEKLAENWIIIDFPYWLSQLGIDVFDCLAAGQEHA